MMKKWYLILNNFGGNIGGTVLPTEVTPRVQKAWESFVQDLAAAGLEVTSGGTATMDIDGKRIELHATVPA